MVNLMSALDRDVFQAVEEYRLPSEEVSYAVGMSVVPGEAPGQFIPIMIIVLNWRAISSTEWLYSTHLSMDFNLSSRDVDDLVSKALAALREKSVEPAVFAQSMPEDG